MYKTLQLHPDKSKAKKGLFQELKEAYDKIRQMAKTYLKNEK